MRKQAIVTLISIGTTFFVAFFVLLCFKAMSGDLRNDSLFDFAVEDLDCDYWMEE